MVSIDDLTAFLDNYMGMSEAIGRLDPDMANGLQVRGRTQVETLVTGVSASMRFFEEAVDLGADALLVHHALTMPGVIHFGHVFTDRLAYLLSHGLSLVGYHYLLDSHPEVGNNAQILKSLGARLAEPYTAEGWGWVGEFEDGVEREPIFSRCAQLFSHPGTQYPFGPELVRRVVAISGGGVPRPEEMDWLMQHRIDLFITGETREWTREMFRECGINFVGGGHYHTERLGIQALGDVVQREVAVTVKFLDLPNPI
jgi:dinuclear metal center YbgI/SA1388 family protein